jgi:uncharacterized pyridoxamine 5'-phosphate oxidase family protein
LIDRQQLKNFLDELNIGVIGSISGEQPQGAVVGVTYIPEKFEFIVGTSIKSRKFKNISANPKVSIAMWHEKVTLQLEGHVTILDRSMPEFEAYQERVIEIHPYKKIFAKDPEQVWLVIKPNWLRLTDISTNPWNIEEEELLA